MFFRGLTQVRGGSVNHVAQRIEWQVEMFVAMSLPY